MRAAFALGVLLLAAPASAQTFTMPFVASVVSSGTRGLQGGGSFFWNGFSGSTFDATSTLRVDRDVETDPSTATGTPYNTVKTIWALTTSGYNVQSFEWTITGEQHNRTRKSAGAQNVAVNGTIFKEKTDNGEETGTSWGLNGNCVDQTGVSDPTTSCIGAELDVGGGVGTDVNRQRVGLHIAGGGNPGAHVAYGAMISPSDQVTIDRGISFQPGGGVFGIGLDFSEAAYTVAPIKLGDSQSIVLDSAQQHGMAYAGGDFMVWGPGGSVFRVNDAGRFYSSYSVEAAPQPPASSTAPCPLDQHGQQQVGAHAWDDRFEYRCIAPNRWRRAALSDW